MNSTAFQSIKYVYEDESRETNNIMNILGYGPEIRQKRRDSYKERDRLRNTWNN
ncbi:hypothetical protein DPMN_081838 [Dreissena polymorpha]|uniref:Uncharacterized protein n=1 Tax=Dreissena polymorpha TaxID=45954 RepID=A0A9D3Y5T5_DREPO|nr:hypothetical protein DPMN_081838 [Dreissena polymorpha]